MQSVNLDHEPSMPMLPVTVPEGSSCNLNDCDTQQMSPGVGQQQQLTRSLVSVGSSVCRICHTNTSKEPLISPCRCKGTLAYVHLACLERWLNQTSRSYCELCRYHFNVVETPRYRLPESLRIWISHPRNRRNMQADLLIFTLLSIVTVGMVTVCLLGMQYFVIEGKKIGISRHWTRRAVCFFLTVVVSGYITTVYLLGKWSSHIRQWPEGEYRSAVILLQLRDCLSWFMFMRRGSPDPDSNLPRSRYTLMHGAKVGQEQVSPWYRWWKSTVNVRLIMDPQLFRRPSNESFQGFETQTTGNAALNSIRQGDANPDPE